MTLPNFLIVILDDASRSEFRPYGNDPEAAYLPNIELFAQQALQFNRCWARPACSMARACIETGREGFHTGIGDLVEDGLQPLLAQEVSIARGLRRATGGAYVTGKFGKNHLSTNAHPTQPLDAGWDFFQGVLRNLQRSREGYYSWNRHDNGDVARCSRYQPDQMVDDAVAWIGKQRQPWLAHVAFTLPHTPYERPPAGQYDSATYPLPSSESDGSTGQNVLFYKAMLQAADFGFGRLLAGIEPGALANTVVFLTTDNGTTAQVVQPPFDPFHAKTTCYELGVGVPLWIRGPSVGVPAAQTEALVSFVDFYKTIIELAGGDFSLVQPVSPFDGVSLVPVLQDPAGAEPNAHIYTEIWSPNGAITGASRAGNRAIMNVAGYKLLTWAAGTTFPQLGASGVGAELYNLTGDPNELSNLLVNGNPAALTGANLSNYTSLVAAYIAKVNS